MRARNNPWIALCAAVGLTVAVPTASASSQTEPGTVQANLEDRGLIRKDGYFPIYLDDETGGFLVEVAADRLGRDILAYTLVEEGQESDISPGIPDRAIVIRLEERRGGRLDVIEVDPTIRYDANSALAKRALAAKPKVVLGTVRIATEEGEGDARTLFVDGLALTVAASGGAFEPQQNQRRQPTTPEVVAAESFSRNLEILVNHDEPERAMFRFSWEGSPDTIRVRRKISLVALPELGVEVREADARVGYFHAEIRDPSRIGRDTAVRYIRRFRLEKKDPHAALSEPVEPIVF